jgi:glycosyltransferase involved in cell wall biosynthesis
MLAREPRRDFAVLIPALDEAENVGRLFTELRAAFDRHGLDGMVVLVDDGSSDGTYEAARQAATSFGPRALVLRHRVHRGKTQALLTAFAATDAALVVLFDADLQYSPHDIPRLLARLDEGWDIVAGRKVGAYEKRAVSTAYNALCTRLFGVPARDLNGLKAMRREVLQTVPLRHDWHRFLVVLAHALGYTVTEIDVSLSARRAGTSKYAGGRRILTGVGDLLVVWFYLRFSGKPMQLFGGAGLALGSAGMLVGVTAVVMRAAGLAPPPFGYRPLLTLVVLLVMVGVALVGFGFVAEMIAILRAEVEALRQSRHPQPQCDRPAPCPMCDGRAPDAPRPTVDSERRR